MKTIKTIFAATIAVFIVGAASASGAGGLKVNMESSSSDKTTVEISSVEISHIEIEVSNLYGDNFYSMKTDAPINSIKKKYDFSGLEDGVYEYRVTIDKESTTKTFEVKNGTVDVINERKSIEPYFLFEDKMLKFTYLNPQLEDVTVTVYDKNNIVVAEAALGNAISIHKAIDFSKERYGSFDVVITNDLDVYEHTVSIQ